MDDYKIKLTPIICDECDKFKRVSIDFIRTFGWPKCCGIKMSIINIDEVNDAD